MLETMMMTMMTRMIYFTTKTCLPSDEKLSSSRAQGSDSLLLRTWFDPLCGSVLFDLELTTLPVCAKVTSHACLPAFVWFLSSQEEVACTKCSSRQLKTGSPKCSERKASLDSDVSTRPCYVAALQAKLTLWSSWKQACGLMFA